MDRRTFVRAALAGSATVLTVSPLAALRRSPGTVITVYKSPSCGCCKAWVTHIEKEGFKAQIHDVDDVTPYKKQYHVPDAMQSCHTAVVGDYVIEGHVPADLRRAYNQQLFLSPVRLHGCEPKFCQIE